jgi:hypothetical protein
MGWRLYLSNQAVQRLDMLTGQPPLLAVWMARGRVYYFDQQTGAQVGERTIPDVPAAARTDDVWHSFAAGLVAPNKAYLPYVRTALGDLRSSSDGRLRLVYAPPAALALELEGKDIALDTGAAARLRAVALDRLMGLVAALDENGLLHLFQQHIPLGAFDLGLRLGDGLPLAVVVAQGGGAVFASDGRQLVLTDSSGAVSRRLEAHYTIGHIACAPDGRLLATTDLDTNVIRVYNGADLTPTHQRHAVDLLAAARQVQLMADEPPALGALNALTLGSKGKLAFALGGMVCVSATSELNALPRARRLL